jgi:hypothetical protein
MYSIIRYSIFSIFYTTRTINLSSILTIIHYFILIYITTTFYFHFIDNNMNIIIYQSQFLKINNIFYFFFTPLTCLSLLIVVASFFLSTVSSFPYLFSLLMQLRWAMQGGSGGETCTGRSDMMQLGARRRGSSAARLWASGGTYGGEKSDDITTWLQAGGRQKFPPIGTKDEQLLLTYELSSSKFSE